MQKTNSVVAVYGTHPQAEEALRAFKSSGFDMKKLSIVGKDYHTEERHPGPDAAPARESPATSSASTTLATA